MSHSTEASSSTSDESSVSFDEKIQGSDQLEIDPSEVVVRLPREVLAELRDLSRLMKVSPTTALRYSLAMTRYLQNEIINKDSSIVIKRKDGFYELEWSDPKFLE